MPATWVLGGWPATMVLAGLRRLALFCIVVRPKSGQRRSRVLRQSRLDVNGQAMGVAFAHGEGGPEGVLESHLRVAAVPARPVVCRGGGGGSEASGRCGRRHGGFHRARYGASRLYRGDRARL